MKLTKITAMAAAIATVAGLGAVAASSANAQVVTDGEKTITLNATSADQLTGHTFKVVKVASYDVYGTAPNQSVTLKTEDGLKTDIAKYLKYTGTGDPLAWAQQQDQAKLDKSTTSPWLGDGTTRGLADKLASKATTTVTSTLSNENKQATFTLDSPGLWLIVDQAVTGKSSKALPILAGTKLTINNTVYSSGSIDMKNQTASVSKTVTDQTVAAGQDASYTITTKVPNYVGYKVNGYQFTVSDKFAHNAPLSYKTDTLKVTVDNKQLTAGTDYTVTGFNSTSKTFIIDLSAYIKAKGFKGTPVDDSKFTDADLVGKNVTVEYKATVTGSTGNTGVANTPTIRFRTIRATTRASRKCRAPRSRSSTSTTPWSRRTRPPVLRSRVPSSPSRMPTASTSPTPATRTATASGSPSTPSRNPPPTAPSPACSPPTRTAR